jgi:hypothetical protein
VSAGNDSDSDDPDATVIITVLPSRFSKQRSNKALLASLSASPCPDPIDITLIPDQDTIPLAQPSQAPARPALLNPAPAHPALGPKSWGPLPKPKYTFWAELMSHRGLSSSDHVLLPYPFTGGKYVWGDMAELGLVWEVSSEDGKKYLVPKLLQHVRTDGCAGNGPVASSMCDILKAFSNARNDDSWHCAAVGSEQPMVLSSCGF